MRVVFLLSGKTEPFVFFCSKDSSSSDELLDLSLVWAKVDAQ